MFARLSVAWFCEGRVCATTALSCCCETPFGQDTNCVSADSASENPRLCAAQCGCESVLIADTDPNTLPLAPSPLPLPVYVALPVVAPPPVPVIEFVYRVPLFAGTRAPPLAPFLSVISLRAPPAFLPHVVTATNVPEAA